MSHTIVYTHVPPKWTFETLSFFFVFLSCSCIISPVNVADSRYLRKQPVGYKKVRCTKQNAIGLALQHPPRPGHCAPFGTIHHQSPFAPPQPYLYLTGSLRVCSREEREKLDTDIICHNMHSFHSHSSPDVTGSPTPVLHFLPCTTYTNMPAMPVLPIKPNHSSRRPKRKWN